MTQSSIRKLAYFSALLAVALVIWIVEDFLPRPAPWMKYGFSYIAILLGMTALGKKYGIALGISRTVVGSIILGKLLSPAFILSICATLAATAVMALLLTGRGKFVSLIGISIAGAFTHLATQIFVAGILFYKIEYLLWLIPVSSLWSIIAGGVVAFITNAVEKTAIASTLQSKVGK